MTKTYKGYKILASDKDSIANYEFRILGVWAGCPNPKEYLNPNPKITKKGEDTFIEDSEMVNLVLEDSRLLNGVTARITFWYPI
jgi:hypothetical protein